MQISMSDAEPIKLARMIVQERWEKLVEWVGEWWAWKGERWVREHPDSVKAEVWKWLEGVVVERTSARGATVLEPYQPTREKVANVVEAMRALVRVEVSGMPAWAGEGEGPDPRWSVAVEDAVLEVREDGTIREWPRDWRWFDGVVLPTRKTPDKVRPVWEETVKGWADGDERWGELLARMSGYLCVGWRGYARGFALVGKIRGGKGVTVRRWVKLLGQKAVFQTSLESMVGSFGLDGLPGARALVVNEIEEGDERTKHAAGRIVKNLMGGDEIEINVKFRRQERMVCGAVPVLVGNELPVIANRGRGVSGKLIALPFTRSWLGREDFYLEDKLDGEVGGLAWWCLEGLVRLRTAERGKEWPETEEGRLVMRKFELLNNAADGFLEWAAVKNVNGFVSFDALWGAWQKFKGVHDVRWHVSRNLFPGWIEREGSWPLTRARDKTGSERGFNGLSLKLEAYAGG